MRILIIEDNADIAASIYDYLEERGHSMDAAPDGVTGLHFAVTNDYDVIILDLGLPGIDGLDVCRRLRKDAHVGTPVLMLTARDTLKNKLEGFDSGADDYLVKPFALEELAARVKVLHDRRHRRPTEALQVADLTLDEAQHRVVRSGKAIALNPIAFKILALLMAESDRVVPRTEIEDVVWGDNPPDSDALRTHVSNLRNAIDKPFGRPLLHTIRGVGYRVADLDDIPADA
ncbi:MAG: response regulator transcription factor [Woeseiaceae bacterium]